MSELKEVQLAGSGYMPSVTSSAADVQRSGVSEGKKVDLMAATKALEKEREAEEIVRRQKQDNQHKAAREAERNAENAQNKKSEVKAKDTAEQLLDSFKQAWGVATDYAKTGTLDNQKVQEAAAVKSDPVGAVKSLVTGAAKTTGADLLNAGSTVLFALDTGEVNGKSRDELVAAPKPQTPEILQKTSDRLADSGRADIEIARETMGDLVTDVGVGLVQLGGDVVAGMLVPGGGMMSMMARSFGGKSRQVRQKGGSLDAQVAAGTTAAVTEYLLERISSVGRFRTKCFGSGALDDILEGVVAAVEDLGRTKSGKA